MGGGLVVAGDTPIRPEPVRRRCARFREADCAATGKRHRACHARLVPVRIGQGRNCSKDFEQGKLRYGQLASEFPDYPNLHFAYGRMLLAAMRPDEAVEEFQRELARDPQNVNSLLEIAAVRYRLDSADGVKYAEQAVQLAPQRPFG